VTIPILGTTLTLDAFGSTDAGLRRSVNEDQFLVATMQRSMVMANTSLPMSEEGLFFMGKPDATLMMVADGMGGKEGGEVASTIAVNTIARYMCNFQPFVSRNKVSGDTISGLREEMTKALVQGDAVIKEASEVSHKNMGTTLTLAYLIWPRLYVAHAGDSRCYLHRDGTVKQITTDHTVAKKLADSGIEVGEASAMHDTLWNALGGKSESEPEVYRARLRANDTILLCSDGLNKHVDDKTIAATLDNQPTAEACCSELIRLANEGGGSDNITVIVARARADQPGEEPKTKRRPSLVFGKIS
jgi:serine/threonine protein phosphatase PrpC